MLILRKNVYPIGEEEELKGLFVENCLLVMQNNEN